MFTTVIRGEGGGIPRTRARPHTNEAPARPGPAPNSRPTAGMNGKPTGSAGASLLGEETVQIPTVILGGGTDTLTDTGSRGPVPPQRSRPDRGDPASEVWALIERAQAGDGAAFGLLYDRYFDTVFRFVYFRVGNRQLAEDLTADTFLRALKRIGSFTWQGRDLGAWLVTIARNLVADHFKSGRYRLEVTTGDVLDADRPDRGPEGSPEAAVIDHITNVDLLKAVKQLNPEQQECIVLRFLHGFSVAETAQTMNKNEGAIKALQYRAVRALARLLPDGFQP
ncbi:sigma-70 family RNA polymerase sigma factor [Dactylosporangium sp. NPDC051484]|uniref:sigma-70 family RNA polymerase sigma factor n=1 Tax=Dactylosporangium sp. NPDC051484 TaxID=3154942 RepID=UPI00344E5AF4